MLFVPLQVEREGPLDDQIGWGCGWAILKIDFLQVHKTATQLELS